MVYFSTEIENKGKRRETGKKLIRIQAEINIEICSCNERENQVSLGVTIEAQSYYVYVDFAQHISNTCYQLLTQMTPTKGKLGHKRCWNDEQYLEAFYCHK